MRRFVITGSIAIILTSLVLFGFRNMLVAPLLIAGIERHAAEQFGIGLTIGRLDGSYLNNITLHQVTIDSWRAGRIQGDSFEIATLAFHYHPTSLLRGFDQFITDADIMVSGSSGRLEILPATDSDTTNKNSDLAWIFLTKQLPTTTVDRFDVEITAGETLLTAQYLSFRMTPGIDSAPETGTVLSLAAGKFRLTNPMLQTIDTSIAVTINSSRDRLEITSINAGGKELVRNAEFTRPPDLRQNNIVLQASLELMGGNLQLDGRLDDNGNTLHTVFTGIDLANLQGIFSENKILPLGIASGRINLISAGPGTTPGLTLEAGITGFKYRTVSLDQLDITAANDNRAILTAEISGRQQQSAFKISNATIPIKNLFAAAPGSFLAVMKAELELNSTDIPAMLAAADRQPAEFPWPIPPHTLRLAGRIAAGTLFLEDSRLETKQGSITLAHAHLPFWSDEPGPLQAELVINVTDLEQFAAVAGINGISGNAVGRLNLDGKLDHVSGLLDFEGKNLTFRKKLVGNVKILAHADSENIFIDHIDIRQKNNTLSGNAEFNGKTIQLLQEPEKFLQAPMLAMLKANLADISLFAEFLPGVTAEGILAAEAQLSGTLKELSGLINFSGEHLMINRYPVGSVHGQLQGKSGLFQITDFFMADGGNRLSATGSFDLGDLSSPGINLQFSASQPELYQQQMSSTLRFSGMINGTLNAEGRFDAPQLMLSVTAEQGNFGNKPFRDFRLQADYADSHLSVSDLAFQVDDNLFTASFTGIPAPDRDGYLARIETLSWRQAQPLLLLMAPAELEIRPGHLIRLQDKATLTGKLGTITLSGSIRDKDDADLLIEASGLNIDQLNLPGIENPLRIEDTEFSVAVKGRMSAASISAKGHVARLSSPKNPVILEGDFDLTLEPAGITIRKFNWQSTDQDSIKLTGVIPIKIFPVMQSLDGQLDLTADLQLFELAGISPFLPQQFRARGILSGHVKLHGSLSNPIGDLGFTATDLMLQGAPPYLPPGPYSLKAVLDVNKDRLAVDTFSITSKQLNASARGTWHDYPPLVALFQKGNKSSGTIDIGGQLTIPDISWVPPEQTGLVKAVGQLDADWKLTGTMPTPQFSGSITYSNGEIRLSRTLPPLRNLVATVDVASDTFNIRTATGNFGGAPFSITGNARRQQNRTYEYNLNLLGENLLLYRDDWTKVRADTDLAVTGPLQNLSIAGLITITEGNYSKNIDLLQFLKSPAEKQVTSWQPLFSIMEPPLKNAHFDIDILSAKPFKLKNNLAGSNMRPDLHLGGTGEFPVLTGRIYLAESSLILPSGKLTAASGLVSIPQNNPDEPTLDINGVSRMQGYDISMAIQGTVKRPEITLSSTPPLPEDDLLLLLLTGRPPQTGNAADDPRGKNTRVAVYLGRELLAKVMNGSGEVIDDAILERLDVEIGRSITRRGDETIEARLLLTENIFKNGKLYLTTEKDLFDDINAGIKIIFRRQ